MQVAIGYEADRSTPILRDIAGIHFTILGDTESGWEWRAGIWYVNTSGRIETSPGLAAKGRSERRKDALGCISGFIVDHLGDRVRSLPTSELPPISGHVNSRRKVLEIC